MFRLFCFIVDVALLVCLFFVLCWCDCSCCVVSHYVDVTCFFLDFLFGLFVVSFWGLCFMCGFGLRSYCCCSFRFLLIYCVPFWKRYVLFRVLLLLSWIICSHMFVWCCVVFLFVCFVCWGCSSCMLVLMMCCCVMFPSLQCYCVCVICVCRLLCILVSFLYVVLLCDCVWLVCIRL